MATTRQQSRLWPATAQPDAVPARREFHFRLGAAWTLWYFLFQGAVGLAWDIRWHMVIGRDTFWSPPHLLIYSGIAISGLLCLSVVLLDTWRFYRGAPGVNATTTWPVFRVFHAPLGFIVAGCGLVTTLLAAPLDNWWHELYGLDVTLWAPFHVMGLIAGLISGVGLVYAFAALATRARREGYTERGLLGFAGLEWATLLALSGVLSLLLTAAQPATTIAPTLDIAGVRILTFPLLLCAFLPVLFVAAVRLTDRPGAATLTLALYTLRQIFIAAFVPWAIRLAVGVQGVEYRTGPPQFSLFLALTPLLFLPAALAVDGSATWWRQRQPGLPALPGRAALWAGLAAALPLIAVAPLLVQQMGGVARQGQLPPEFVVPPFALPQALLLATPFALSLALLSATLGVGWGAILRYNDR